MGKERAKVLFHLKSETVYSPFNLSLILDCAFEQQDSSEFTCWAAVTKAHIIPRKLS